MNKEIINHGPGLKNIESVANQIRSTQSLHIVMFADLLIRYIEITLKRNDLSRLQSIALHNLVLNGGSLTPTELAKAMFRSKHSMTKIIDSLEERGLAVRNGNQKDRRSTHIQITLNGLKYVKQDIQKGDIWMQEATDTLSSTEKEFLAQISDQLFKKITEIINGMPLNNKID